jgi:hypothetical protein
MKNMALFGFALVVTLAVSACNAPQPKALTAAAAIPDYCRLVVRPSGERFYRCKVRLTVNQGQLSMSVDPFLVPADLPVVAIWVLTQNGYYFGSDDGIFVTAQNGQFSDPCASDDDGTCAIGGTPTRYKWRVRNSDAFSSAYCVQFHDSAGTSYAFDPTIANSLALIPSSVSTTTTVAPKASGTCF